MLENQKDKIKLCMGNENTMCGKSQSKTTKTKSVRFKGKVVILKTQRLKTIGCLFQELNVLANDRATYAISQQEEVREY